MGIHRDQNITALGQVEEVSRPTFACTVALPAKAQVPLSFWIRERTCELPGPLVADDGVGVEEGGGGVQEPSSKTHSGQLRRVWKLPTVPALLTETARPFGLNPDGRS